MSIHQSLPPLRQMQYMVMLGRHKSFSRAADACHVTQSTFSAGIAALENMLGQKLVNRSTRSVSFTALGEEVLNKAEQLIHLAADLTSLAKTAANPLSGPLRLGIIPTIAPYILPQILPALQRNWPELQLNLQEDLTARLLDQLNRGNLDVALIAFPYETPGLQQMNLFSEEFVLASTNSKKSGLLHIRELDDIELLLLEEGHCLRSHALAACRSDNVSKTFRATSLPTLIQMVQNGYGATLLPEMVVGSGAIPNGLTLQRFKSPAPSREIGLVWKKHNVRDSDIKHLANTIILAKKPAKV